ncbi:MAG: hypothetical protein WCO54_10180 [Bacteroidota bacterium]
MTNLTNQVKRSISVLAFTFLMSFSLFSQQLKRPSITVLNIDTKGVQLDAQQMGNLTRIELEKLDTFDVTDRYDVAYIIEKNKLNITNCYGKMCLLEIGNTIKTDYMLTGSVELYGQTIIVTFRFINIAKASIEKTTVMEFLNLPLEVQSMTGISIRKMFGRPNDENILIKLTQKFNYESSMNNPNKDRLNLSGPRFGYTFIIGDQVSVLTRSRKEGGYDAYPAMFQFGYQFEKQYLNEGNYQALFELIPMLTGIDQQMVIPSLTFLNGFRNIKNGWEVAIGPAISVATYAKVGKYENHLYTDNELHSIGIYNIETKRQLDSRGDLGFNSALVLALGKTYKSGKMNIPVNLYATIPTDGTFRLGISVGYNSKK